MTTVHTPNTPIVHGKHKQRRGDELALHLIKQQEDARHLRREASPASRQRGGR